jgi:hypothetical protein
MHARGNAANHALVKAGTKHESMARDTKLLFDIKRLSWTTKSVKTIRMPVHHVHSE